MYRSQYPDAPNLFSNLRRRPSLWVVFRRSWLTSIIGIVIALAGTTLLVLNEGRAVQKSRVLEEGHRDLIIPETTSVVFEENNGKLVLVRGELHIEEPLSDPLYGISIHAVKMKKRVKMYQWHEVTVTRNIPGVIQEDDHDSHAEITYSYIKAWTSQRIYSDSFNNPLGHHNPETWPDNTSVRVSPQVKVGAFYLGKELKDKFVNFVSFTSDERPSNPSIKMHAGLYFHTQNVWQPEVGDLKVQFFFAGKNGDQYTVVGRQTGREIRPYLTESGSHELLFLHQGLRDPEEVFRFQSTHNVMEMWLFRIGGWIMIFVGFTCVSHLIEYLADGYPYARNALVLGVSSLPLSLSISLSLLFMGMGWIMFRPLLGFMLIGIAVSPFIVMKFRLCRDEHPSVTRQRI